MEPLDRINRGAPEKGHGGAPVLQPEQCSLTAKHAKFAKKLPIFKALTRENSEMRFGRFRSGSSADLMSVGNSLRSLRSWR